MAEENAEPFRAALEAEDHHAVFSICYGSGLDSCPPDVLSGLVDFGWRRFVRLSGMDELGPRLSPSAASEWPDVLLRWVWQNRWMLTWDYSQDLINWLNVMEALLYEVGSRCGQPRPTAYRPMPFLDKAAREEQRGMYEAYYVCPDWVTRLGIEAYDVSRKRSELHKSLGQQPSRSQVVEAILDERIAEARSFHILSALHHEKALFLHWCRKDCLVELREAARMRLLSYRSNGVDYVHVVTCLGQFKCESCLAQKRVELTVEQALQTMPVPNLACTSPVGYCRCHYFPTFFRFKHDDAE